jgi:hypothetical protein
MENKEKVKGAKGIGKTNSYLYKPSPANEDVYDNGQIDAEIDPENPSTKKRPDKDTDGDTYDAPGEDLDVPGSELDDADEKIGSEDEENNYYSIGGDGHNNLEEEKE